jgi:hypothetical protein
LSLYDTSGNRLARNVASRNTARIDYSASAGQEFLLQLSGKASAVDLKIVDLFTRSTDRVTVSGTSGSDSFGFAADGSTQAVAVNGVSYSIGDPGIQSIILQGGAGDDRFDVTPSRSIAVSISGGDQFNADTLIVHTDFRQVARESAAVIAAGLQPVTHDGVEQVVVDGYSNIQFNAAEYTTGENAGSVKITVTRTPGYLGPASVNYSTQSITATAGLDFTPASGTLRFAAGQTSATFTISTLRDSVVEQRESLALILSNPTGGARLGAGSVSTMTIVDNTPPISIQFKTATARVAEPGKTVTLTVTRSGDKSKALAVHYATANGTAQASRDYAAASGTLTFKANETSKTIKFKVIDDKLVEGNETFRVVLTNPNGGATLGRASIATVTIIDNDRSKKTASAQRKATMGPLGIIQPTASQAAPQSTIGRFLFSRKSTGIPQRGPLR